MGTKVNIKPIIIAVIAIVVFEIISSVCTIIDGLHNYTYANDEIVETSSTAEQSESAEVENIEETATGYDKYIPNTKLPKNYNYEVYEVSEFEIEDSNVIDSNESEVIEVFESDPSTWYYPMTEDELYELATLVYLEGGIESYECQEAIASVVINRATTSGKSTHDVIYAKHQFAPAKKIKQSEPLESTMKAAKCVAMYGPSIPEYVTFFRADYYFDWGSRYVDYVCIDRTYFTYDSRLKAKLESEEG